MEGFVFALEGTCVSVFSFGVRPTAKALSMRSSGSNRLNGGSNGIREVGHISSVSGGGSAFTRQPGTFRVRAR